MASTTELHRIVLHLRKFLKARLREALDARPNDWGDLVHEPLDEIIDKHLVPEHDLLTVTRADILSRLLRSAQNRQSASKVISGSIVDGRDLDEKWATLGKWLFGFNPEAILAHWADDEGAGREDVPNAKRADEKLMDFFLSMKARGNITGEVRTGTKSLWPMFARTIISAAEFVTRYPTSEAFIDWIKNFRTSDDTIAALPLILSQEVYGLGLPLAADFLKELGVCEFPKPDVHVKKLASALNISDAKSDYRLMRDLMAAARQIEMTPYALDKLLWLVGSGRFYRVKNEEKGFVTVEIGRRADDFIAYMATVAWKDERAADKPTGATSYSASP